MTYRILLACYDKVISSEVSRYLSKAGYQVKAVSKSEEILHTIKYYNPDLTLLFEFPKSEMNIWEFAKRLRRETNDGKMFVFLIINPVKDYSYLDDPIKRELYDHILVLPIVIKEIVVFVDKLLK